MSEQIADRCNALWERAVAQGKAEYTAEGDRQRDGSYSSGFRHTFSTWNLAYDDYDIRAIEAEMFSFNLSADTTRYRRTLEIRRGAEIVFKAVHERGGKIERFAGADERYQGTEQLPEKTWRVDMGEIPISLIT